jgi:hypothetical protein
MRSIVRNNARPLAGKLLSGPLNDRLHLELFCGIANLPVDDEPAVAIEDAAKEVERPVFWFSLKWKIGLPALASG